MSASLIDGKALAAQIRGNLAERVVGIRSAGLVPGLAVVIVGDDPASRLYVNMKKRACDELGIYSREHALAASTTQGELLDLIRSLNEDSSIHGILVQLPLPKHLDEQAVIEAIRPEKDVDGLHPQNLGALVAGQEGFVPCTPAGIIKLIKSTGTEIQGKNCVMVGRSNIVGKPTALLLLRENGTVTICHSRTVDLPAVCRQADILVAAVGKAALIKRDMVKPGAVVIDVGTNRVDGKLMGDVDFEAVKEVAGYITPVPGGVGPMTIAMLMENTVKAAVSLQANR
ncbi:MAG: bifunctional methylenetetrahydrofolate dehydrogenase/methenyltetrahydrofolate cyclohydrolase FolD [Firmicutes bacterium]|nr:bifunctional methylenetetrahydrofolate dehydrogenase/methenyltetrahydrofolate cyclohydrolase FolD [Bacillota bacterium]